MIKNMAKKALGRIAAMLASRVIPALLIGFFILPAGSTMTIPSSKETLVTARVLQERADKSATDGTSAFSREPESAAADIAAVNEAPVVDLNGRLPGVDYMASFQSQNQPAAVSSPDAIISDAEGTEIVSLVVTLKNRPDGSRESLAAEETSSGIETTSFDPITGIIRFKGLAPVEDYTALLRSLSYTNSAAVMSTEPRVIEFVANDGSENSLVSSATVNPVASNDAPELDPSAEMTFSSILEDDILQIGDTISELLGSAQTYPIQDNDPDPRRGFAIVAAENNGGQWQFNPGAGNSWFAVGDVSDSTALLLDQQARIRFLPEPDFGGESRSITVRAWDQSEGFDGASDIDTTANGGTMPFSTDRVLIPIYVQPVNDPPVLSLTERTRAEFVEGNGPVVVAGPGLSINDVDNQMLQSATVAISNLPLNEPDVLAALANGSGITASYDRTSGVLRLSGNASLADYQSVLRSVTFNNLSSTPFEGERQISFAAGDGTVFSNEVIVPVTVAAVNTPPLLDLNGADAGGTDNVVTFSKDGVVNGGSVHLSDLLLIEDADNTTLIGATIFLENGPDGAREAIAADVAGTAITAVSSDDGRRIELSGSDTIPAYQQVLRTAVYYNTSTYANRAVREITFSVQDSANGLAHATTSVIILPQFAHIPFIAHVLTEQPPVEEPNNSCDLAVPISVNIEYEFGATDINDWFSFSLAESAVVTVELSEFEPVDGQLVVAGGTCADPQLLGHNGDYSSEKTITLGTLRPGRYYIWLINDGPTNLDQPYRLRVTAD